MTGLLGAETPSLRKNVLVQVLRGCAGATWVHSVAYQNVILCHYYGRNRLALRRHHCGKMFWCWYYMGVVLPINT